MPARMSSADKAMAGQDTKQKTIAALIIIDLLNFDAAKTVQA
jgi:hypothetical protein